MPKVIVHGKEGSGKTRRSKELLNYLNCTKLIDEWDGVTPLKDGELALTNLAPPFNRSGKGVTVINVVEAKKPNNGVDNAKPKNY